MIFLLAALGLAGVYAFTLGSLAWEDWLLGLALAVSLIWIYRAIAVKGHQESTFWTVRTLLQTPRYVWIVVWDVLVGTWQVATYVVGLRRLAHPGIIRIPFEEESEIRLGVALLALSLSPGSFVVDVDMENRIVLAHFIDISDPDRLRQEIHRKYFVVPGSHHEPAPQEAASDA